MSEEKNGIVSEDIKSAGSEAEKFDSQSVVSDSETPSYATNNGAEVSVEGSAEGSVSSVENDPQVPAQRDQTSEERVSEDQTSEERVSEDQTSEERVSEDRNENIMSNSSDANLTSEKDVNKYNNERGSQGSFSSEAGQSIGKNKNN